MYPILGFYGAGYVVMFVICYPNQVLLQAAVIVLEDARGPTHFETKTALALLDSLLTGGGR